MNISQQKFFSNQQNNIKVQPQTVKNANNNVIITANGSMHRAIKINSDSRDIDSNGMLTQASNRGQKEIIIRKNSSKKIIRPTSQGGSHTNTREREDPVGPPQYKQKNKAGVSQNTGLMLSKTNAIDNSLMNNSSYVVNSNINSPVNNH